MMVIANVFPKFNTVNKFVRPLCENPHFRRSFHKQHMKVSQKLLKYPWENVYEVFLSFWEKLISKMSPLLLPEILLVFLNRLTAEAKYPIEDWENLPLPMQMELSDKQKTFSQVFVLFLESTSNIKHFEKKDDGHS